MPRFYTESEVDVYPEEFLRECSDSEIKDAIDWLVDTGHISKNHLTSPTINERGSSSFSNYKVSEALHVLYKVLSLDKEDEDALIKLANKYEVIV